MQNLLFINTFFEEELTSSSLEMSPVDWLEKHPLYLQLHYLSFLIHEPDETPLLSHEPEPSYFSHLKTLGFSVPTPVFFSNSCKTSFSKLSSWGSSPSLSKWALANKCAYPMPDLPTLKKINSKQFSHLFQKKLKHACLIFDEPSLVDWWHSFKGPKVLKTLYGSSGRGHFISLGNPIDIPKALLFLQKNKTLSPSLLGEPWVERVLDFSSQWTIHENGSHSYLGATLCENSSKGIYHKSIAGPVTALFKKHLPFLEEHLLHAKQAIEQIKSLGFFGNVGFDAMIYKDPITDETALIPILEINARKTMGLVALKLYQKLAPKNLLSIRYERACEDPFRLLPSWAICPKTGAKVTFPKQLILETNLI